MDVFFLKAKSLGTDKGFDPHPSRKEHSHKSVSEGSRGAVATISI